MSDTTISNGGSAFGTAACRCGALRPAQQAAWGCTDCGGDCCAACAFWLESTVYCPDCTDRLLAA